MIPNQASASTSVTVDGALIALRTWGRASDPAVYLVHGSSANGAWWDHVAPTFARQWRFVVAHDMSGHGDSVRRDEYGLALWAGELRGVIEATSRRDDPVLVGHSMGGSVSLRAAIDYGNRLAGVVIVDTVVREVSDEEMLVRRTRSGRAHRVYPTREAAVERFRTVPESKAVDPAVLRHIAEASITQVDGGWTWKFDLRIFDKDALRPVQLGPVRCPVRVLRGDRGLVEDDMVERIVSRLECPPATVVSDCGHHVMLEQPEELARRISEWLDLWQPRGAGPAPDREASRGP